MYILNRYFLTDDVLTRVEKSHKKNTMLEFATHINDCKNIFYQKIKNKYYKVIVLNDRIVKRKEINKKDFLKKQKNKALSHTQKKDIFLLDDISLIKIDNNMVYLETDKNNIKNEYADFIKKSWDIKQNILQNSTANTNLFKIFKKLEKTENPDMNTILKKEYPINDIVRVKLYELYIRLSQNKAALIDKEYPFIVENIFSYKNNLKSVLTILNQYKNIFEKELLSKVIENLFYIDDKIEFCEKIKGITKQLYTYKKCLEANDYIEFLKKEDNLITNDVESFLHFLQTREYFIIMKQLELLIKENTLDDNKALTKSSKSLINKKFKKRYKKIKKSIKKYIDCEDIESYKKIYNKVEKLYILNKEFSIFFSRKRYYKRKQILSRLKKDFKSYIEVLMSEDIAKNNFSDSDLKCIVKNLEKIKYKKSKAIKKSIKNLKKSKKLFVS